MWKPVIGYEGLYEVSDQGEVRSLSRWRSTGKGRCRVTARMKSGVISPSGHLRVHLYREGKMQTVLVHHLVLEAFVGPCPDGMECRHLDGYPANNKLENLCWGTRKENMVDRDKHGRTQKGEEHYAAKLTCHDVREIRRSNEKQRTLATRFKVAQSTISRIRAHKRYT